MGLKIGEIARRAGVAPSTIRYYVHQGLLPEPHKVNKSMAYYDESCVEQIHVIRQLQEQRYLPLTVIKNVMRRLDEGLNLEQALAIEDAVFPPDETTGELVDREAFLALTGLNDTELQEAQNLGLLMPCVHEESRTLFNEEDIRFARDILKRFLVFGRSLEDLAFYVTLGRRITEEEKALRNAMVHDLPPEENIKVTAEVSAMADFMRSYVLRRLFQRRVEDAIERRVSGPEVQ